LHFRRPPSSLLSQQESFPCVGGAASPRYSPQAWGGSPLGNEPRRKVHAVYGGIANRAHWSREPAGKKEEPGKHSDLSLSFYSFCARWLQNPTDFPIRHCCAIGALQKRNSSACPGRVSSHQTVTMRHRPSRVDRRHGPLFRVYPCWISPHGIGKSDHGSLRPPVKPGTACRSLLRHA